MGPVTRPADLTQENRQPTAREKTKRYRVKCEAYSFEQGSAGCGRWKESECCGKDQAD